MIENRTVFVLPSTVNIVDLVGSRHICFANYMHNI